MDFSSKLHFFNFLTLAAQCNLKREKYKQKQNVSRLTKELNEVYFQLMFYIYSYKEYFNQLLLVITVLKTPAMESGVKSFKKASNFIYTLQDRLIATEAGR